MRLETRKEFARFMSKVKMDNNTGCWEWQACKSGGYNGGYGHFGLRGKVANAHQVSYETFVGPTPSGLVLDHKKCNNRGCVNPRHMEPTTHKKNILRGNSLSAKRKKQTHCSRGHELSGDNLYLYGEGRHCKTCRRMHLAKRKERFRNDPDFREHVRKMDRERYRREVDGSPRLR